MLSSIPPVPPRDTWLMWSPSSSHLSANPQDPQPPGQQQQQQQQQQQNGRDRRPVQQQKTYLSILQADEELLASRKANTRHFGSTWLRPPGITKTYQAMIDEAAEKAEQAEQARREQALLEQQQAAEAEATRLREEQGGEGMEVDDAEDMERDLDEEVPDADNVQSGDEDAFIQDEGEDIDEEGGHDLDDDVPEAGSYEHTDTEEEFPSDSEHEDGNVLRESEAPSSPEPDGAQQQAQLVTPQTAVERSGGGAGTPTGRGPTVVQNFRVPLLMPTFDAPQPRSSLGSVHTEQDLESSMLVSSPIHANTAGHGQPSGRTGRPVTRNTRFAHSGRRPENGPSS